MKNSDSSLLVRVEPRAVKEHKAILVSKLKFDPNNVRFTHETFGKEFTQEKMYELVKSEPDLDILKEQIKQAKKVYEELVVDDKFFVKEGNRRLACLKMIQEEVSEDKNSPYKDMFDSVKCAVLSETADPIDIEIYLTVIHVKGRKAWDAFDKASHIYYLNKIGGISYDDIVKYAGMSKKTVKRAIDVYLTTINYNKGYKDDSTWWRKYTYFDELYKSKGLEEWRRDDKNLNRFMEWVHDERFNDVRYVRNLPEILKDKAAFKTFESHDAKTAIAALSDVDPSFSDRSFKIIKDATMTFRSMTRDEITAVRKSPAKIKMIKELDAEIKELLRWIDK